MGSTFTSKKKKKNSPSELHSVASLKNKIETDLALGAGTTRVKSIDPIYYITEGFRSTFDLTGQSNASRLAGKNIQSSVRGRQQESSDPPTLGEELPHSERTTGEKSRDDFYGRFSEIAFKNGKLASAILRDEGQTMFVQCIKRALGQSELTYSMTSKLFEKSSKLAPLKNPLAKKIAFKHYTNRAIGLVVESNLSARRTLELFEHLAAGDSEKEAPEMKDNIIPNVYPFLNISEDTKRMAEYEEKLRELTSLEGNTPDRKQRNEIAGQKAVLTAGIIKTQSLINKKRQLQNQFYYRLEQLLENSHKAAAAFTAPGFADNVVEELIDSLELPEDDSDDLNEDKPEEPPEKS